MVSRTDDSGGGNGLRRIDAPGYEAAAPTMAAAASSGYAGVQDLLRILKRRRRLVAWTVGIILLFTFVALLRMTPLYNATSVVLIEPEDAAPGATTAAAVASPNEEVRIATKVELLSSRALARRVARSLNLEDYHEFAPGDRSTPGLFDRVRHWLSPDKSGPSQTALQFDREEQGEALDKARIEAVTDRLIDHLQIERIGKSHLISVTATSADPYLASLIANRLTETHIKAQLSEAKESDEQQAAVLRARVEEMRTKLRDADFAVANYRRDHGMPEQYQDITQSQLIRLGGELATASADSAASAMRAAGAQTSSANAEITNAASPLLNDLRGQEAGVRKRLAELTSFYGAGYPEVAATNAQLAELRNRIQSEATRVAAEMRNDAGAVAARQNVLAGAVGGLQGRVASNTTAGVELGQLVREAQTTQALFISLLSRFKDASVKADAQQSDTSIISRASVPDSPSYPMPERALVVALIGAVILAIIMALAAETFDDRLRSAEQVRRQLGLSTLAMVPEVSQESGGAPVYEMMRSHPRSFFAESMRNLVIEIESRRSHAGSQVVVVTSSLPDEGKTTIALGLAAAAAAIGRSAIVVDLDLRRADHEVLPQGEHATVDVVSFLTDQARIDEVLAPEPQRLPFAAISVDRPVVDPGGLLESPRVAELLAELRQRFQLVVLNAPPILPVRDAKTLSALADGALLVVRWGKTDADVARTAVEAFGDNFIGAVINRVDYERHARSGFGDAIEYSARSGGNYYLQGAVGSGPRRLLTRWLGRA